MVNRKLKRLCRSIIELCQVVCGCGRYKNYVKELFGKDLDQNLEKRQGNTGGSLLNY